MDGSDSNFREYTPSGSEGDNIRCIDIVSKSGELIKIIER
jgi:hypothetical protein